MPGSRPVSAGRSIGKCGRLGLGVCALDLDVLMSVLLIQIMVFMAAYFDSDLRFPALAPTNSSRKASDTRRSPEHSQVLAPS